MEMRWKFLWKRVQCWFYHKKKDLIERFSLYKSWIKDGQHFKIIKPRENTLFCSAQAAGQNSKCQTVIGL